MIASERRLRERQQRIREIIDAAKRIFERQGFGSATMLDIANHSELSRRTLYLYFRNKDEVSLAVAADTLARLGESIEAVSRGAGPAIDRLRAVLEAYLALHRQDPSSFQVILNFDDIVKAVGGAHALVDDCYAAIARIRDYIADILVQGAADGSIRSFPLPAEAASTLVAMVHGTLLCAVSCANIIGGPLHLESEAFIDSAFGIIAHYLPPS